MSCECTNIACISVDFNPCSDGAQLSTITANETGNWTGIIEFAGGLTSFSIGVVDGEKVIIPVALLNENYVHELKLYKVNGDLLNDTCYQVNARAIFNSATYPVLKGIDVFDYTVTVAGHSISFPHFADGDVLLLATDAQDYNSAFFTQGVGAQADTITAKNDVDGNPKLDFYIGQIITVTLKIT